MNLFQLFRSVSLSHVRHEKLKMTLTVFGMALGIACYTAIRLANFNAFRSFAEASRLFTEGSELAVVNPDGRVPETLIPTLLNLTEIDEIQPYSSKFVEARRSGESIGMVQVTAVDPFRQKLGRKERLNPRQALELLRGETALTTGRVTQGADSIQLVINARPVTLHVVEIQSSSLSEAYGGKVVLLDIAAFQRLFSDYDLLDRINLKLRTHVERAAFVRKLEHTLHRTPGLEHLRIERSDARLEQAERMTAAFRLNLNFLSAISLLVSLLLIFNSMSYLVLKRRAEIGILRSLGCSERNIFALLSLESVAIGIMSSGLGIVLGRALASVLVQAVGTTFSTLYLPTEVTRVVFSASIALESLIIGTAVSFLGSLPALLEACRSAPRDTFGYQAVESAFERSLGRTALFGTAVLAAALITSRPELLQVSLLAGFIPPLLLMLGVVLIVPYIVMQACERLLRSRWAVPVEFSLGVSHIRSTLKRNSAATAAMTVALAMFFGVSMMILSFRHTVQAWIEHITTADVFVSAGQAANGEAAGYLPEEVVQFLMNYHAATALDWTSAKRIVRGGREVRLIGVRFEPIRDFNRLLFKQSQAKDVLRRNLSRPDAVLISETYANRFGARIGDKLQLKGSKGLFDGEIVNIFYDYSSEQGTVLVPFEAFSKLDNETRKQGVSLYLTGPTSVDELRRSLQSRFPEYNLLVRDNRQLRGEVLRIFDDTFKVTYALQAIALVISTFTILNTIAMMLFERRRELAVLRAIGAARGALVKMISAESTLLGFFALAFGLLAGIGLALQLVFVINRFFFGWSVQFFVPIPLIVTSSGLVILIAAAAGWSIGRHASTELDTGCLRYE